MDRKLCLLLLLLSSIASPVFAATCESLSTLKLPSGTITSAQQVAAGAFVPPGADSEPGPMFNPRNLPAFCRVQATLKPAPDSDIKIEVWMPLTGWNHNFRGVGNGGFAGSIDYPGLGTAISSGFASASTNTGHDGAPVDATWAKGHPDKIVDFGWRAIHETAVTAKAIIQAFYGEAPNHNYFTGCSNGGRQGLMEAQRFPADYDGIIVGAPANYWTKVFATFIFDIQAISPPGAYIGAEKIPVIAKAVNAACDANDGVKDGVVDDPRACRFNPETLLCKQAESADCLNAAQVAALKKIYAGPRDSAGKQIFPGFEPGGEEGPGGWVLWIGRGPGTDLQTLFANGFFGNMITTPQPLDLKTIDIAAAVKLADDQQARTFNADDPNLKPFAARGGKLIIYHGWSDAALPPLGAINYFESVQAALGRQQTDAFMRLYMAPGVQHCGGGPGANAFGQSAIPSDPQHDIHEALEQWVEKGTAPDRIIASKFVNPLDHSKGVSMTRPLCSYPQFAKYKGTGDSNDAGNFECVPRTAKASSDDSVGSPALGPISLEDKVVYTLKNTDIKAPKPLHTPEPKYSRSARKKKIQGIVKLSALIGADGIPRDIKIVQPLEPTLDANAIAAVEKWKFVPAKKDGKPVAVAMQLEVDYRLY
ncbi:MAG TPA: TonB family protein [Candidatus Angelobacter sp.]|nr:TonB family protein [Candidatus Angelobacter sp.]